MSFKHSFFILARIKNFNMRTSKNISVLFVLLLFAFVGCKKDKNPPTITINGSNPASVNVGGSYTDAGATAVNPDGSEAIVTADISSVNTATAGAFCVSYSAENEYGIAEAGRIVNVVIGQGNYIGTYDLASDCSTTEFPLNAAQEAVALSTADSLQFDNFFNLVGGTAVATINGSTITFPNQTIGTFGGDIVFDGTGTMNGTGTEMTVTFNYDSSAIPFVGGVGSCTATITKQ